VIHQSVNMNADCWWSQHQQKHVGGSRSARSTETAKREGLPFTALIIDVRSKHMAPGDCGRGCCIELLNDASVSARYSVWPGLSPNRSADRNGAPFHPAPGRRAVEWLCIISIFYGAMKNTTATTTTALKSATVAFDQAGQ
jgi:hypothetical protein